MPESKTAKKAAPKKAAAKAPEFKIPGPVVDFQKRVLEGQRALFERGFDALTSAQERQEDAWNARLAGSSVVPEPLKELSTNWTESQRRIRSTYRDAVVRNYALLGEWVGGLAKSA